MEKTFSALVPVEMPALSLKCLHYKTYKGYCQSVIMVQRSFNLFIGMYIFTKSPMMAALYYLTDDLDREGEYIVLGIEMGLVYVCIEAVEYIYFIFISANGEAVFHFLIKAVLGVDAQRIFVITSNDPAVPFPVQ